MRTPEPAADHLTRLVEHSGADVLAYFERRGRDREDAADLLGETLLVAWRRAEIVPRDETQARMWLFGVARGVLSNHSRGVRRRLRLADALRERLATAHGESRGDREDALVAAIEELPEDLAELVRLVHWDGFTLVEAATLTGVPASTARGRYARARELLYRSLVRHPADLAPSGPPGTWDARQAVRPGRSAGPG